MKVWIWIIVIVVILIGAYFLMTGGETDVPEEVVEENLNNEEALADVNVIVDGDVESNDEMVDSEDEE